MATVYLARASGAFGFGREVAIKLMHSYLGESPDFSRELLEEAKLAARIRHANVVSCIDVGEDAGAVFLVMDYVEGDTLSGLQTAATAVQERLPVGVAMRILVDALTGLQAAHELHDETGTPLDVVHRDFSPQNILVGTDGIGRLTDFGIAKAATRIGTTVDGIIKGKLVYMAPEQARGESVDRRCDVWAAGIVAWQLLTGRPIYETAGDVALLLRIATETPPRLGASMTGATPALEEAVAWALTPDLAARCPTARDFQQALTAACRQSHQWAETEEVATCVTRLVGPKLASRRVLVSKPIDAERSLLSTDVPTGEITQPAVTKPGAEASEAPTGKLEISQSAATKAQSGGRSSPPATEVGRDAEITKSALTKISAGSSARDPEITKSALTKVSPGSARRSPAEEAAGGARRDSSARLVVPTQPIALPVTRAPTAPEEEEIDISVSHGLPMPEIDSAHPPRERRDVSNLATAKPTARRHWLGTVVALPPILLLCAIGWRWARPRPSSVVTAPQPSPVVSAEAPTMVTAAEGATSPQAAIAAVTTTAAPQPAPDGSERAVAIHANAPIAALRVGGRAIPLTRPTKDVTVRLTADDAARAQRVEVTGTDGRRVTTPLGPAASAISVSFPPRVGSPTTKGADDAPPLAPMPYGQHR
jgi:serine/threonine-protein kinase